MIFVELDLWPNFLLVASQRRVPVIVVNGRMSPRSHRGYMRFRPWVRSIFGTVKLFAVQEERYKQRVNEVLDAVEEEAVRVQGGAALERMERQVSWLKGARAFLLLASFAPREVELSLRLVAPLQPGRE